MYQHLYTIVHYILLMCECALAGEQRAIKEAAGRIVSAKVSKEHFRPVANWQSSFYPGSSLQKRSYISNLFRTERKEVLHTVSEKSTQKTCLNALVHAIHCVAPGSG